MEVRFAEVSGWILRYLLSIEISDILDIALMAFILYKIFTLVQSTKAASLVKGLMIFLAALVVSSALHLNGINYIMRSMANLGLLALIILFQPEIRRVLEQVGSRRFTALFIHEETVGAVEQAISQTVLACTEMSQTRTGALIVFEREMQLDDIEYIIKNNRDSVVIIDEAYADFGDVSVLGLVNKYENLLVVRTYSKSRALAGMRIGYAIGSKTLISALKAVKFSYNSYTMNYVSICAGAAAINDDKYFKEIVSKVINTREKAKDTLKKLGFFFTDSKTNFLFATHKSVPAEEIFEELKKRKIYVRYFNKPRINNYLRITIGTDEEMEKLYEALKEIVK
mgnify:CR=1 FL=1